MGVAREAILIDPVIEQAERDVGLVRQLGLNLQFVLNTHVHADHITGTGRLKRLLPNTKSVISKASGAKADILVSEGHTEGCVTYVHSKAGWAFTGDASLIRGCGRTDFQGGSAANLYENVWGKVLSLPDSTQLYPAHDYKGLTCTTVGEEKQHNPRLTKPKEEFIALMAGLGLPYPKKIDESLPA